jgi:hypothetical protein
VRERFGPLSSGGVEGMVSIAAIVLPSRQLRNDKELLDRPPRLIDGLGEERSEWREASGREPPKGDTSRAICAALTPRTAYPR